MVRKSKNVRHLQESVPRDLNRVMQEPALTEFYGDVKRQARACLDAGLLLADLGVAPPALDELVEIPGAGFRIGRYPVTNAQYRQFVAAGGYDEVNRLRWWSDAGWDYKQKAGWRAPRLWDAPRFAGSTQPVVGVSWYEAEAYCNWLTGAWREAGVIGADERVRLPTQAEWELAARGAGPAPVDKAEDYPWRGPFDAKHANTEESDLGQTTPVHMYPEGATLEGVWDLSGNVWEWTWDKQKDDTARLKGGAYYFSSESATASSVLRFGARHHLLFFGFRVVAVPISR